MDGGGNQAVLRELLLRVRQLERDNVGQSVGAGGGGGGFRIDEVSALPPIPGSGSRIVYWKLDEPDDGHWIARAGWTKWRPIDCLTDRDGEPA